jgi:hypothetical protein
MHEIAVIAASADLPRTADIEARHGPEPSDVAETICQGRSRALGTHLLKRRSAQCEQGGTIPRKPSG